MAPLMATAGLTEARRQLLLLRGLQRRRRKWTSCWLRLTELGRVHGQPGRVPRAGFTALKGSVTAEPSNGWSRVDSRLRLRWLGRTDRPSQPSWMATATISATALIPPMGGHWTDGDNKITRRKMVTSLPGHILIEKISGYFMDVLVTAELFADRACCA